MGPGTTRAEHPVCRRAADGGSPRRLQAVPEGNRGPDADLGHLHGEVRAGPRWLELPHSLEPVARWQQRIRRWVDAWTGAMLRCLPLVPRRRDRASPRGDGLLRAYGELLQTVRRRVLGADAARLELRQSHRGFPRRRARFEPEHRV